MAKAGRKAKQEEPVQDTVQETPVVEPVLTTEEAKEQVQTQVQTEVDTTVDTTVDETAILDEALKNATNTEAQAQTSNEAVNEALKNFTPEVNPPDVNAQLDHKTVPTNLPGVGNKIAELQLQEQQQQKVASATPQASSDGLSFQAKKWLEYITYQKQDPEEFLKKYPNHKFKAFIEEAVAHVKKQKGE